MNQLAVASIGNVWTILDGERMLQSEGYPTLGKPALVVTDFGGAQQGVAAFEGSLQHAEALIERRLREDGLLDGEAKILLHHQTRVGSGFQALYTAVPLERWQKEVAWAEGQADHCILMPLAGLLWQKVSASQSVVLRAGRHFFFLGMRQERIVHAQSIAYSEEIADLEVAIGSLADRINSLYGLEAKSLDAIWYTISESADVSEAVLVKQLIERAQIEVHLGAHVQSSQAGRAVVSGLPDFVAVSISKVAVSSPFSKIAFLAEKWLPRFSLASIGIAAMLIGVGLYWQFQANQSFAEVRDITQQIESKESQLPVLALKQQMPPDYQKAKDFLIKVGESRHKLNPVAELEKIRSAAEGNVHVLRVRTDKLNGLPIMKIEGWVEQPAVNTPKLAKFVEQLRLSGYTPVAVDPAGAASNQQSGFFAYQLLLQGVTYRGVSQ